MFLQVVIYKQRAFFKKWTVVALLLLSPRGGSRGRQISHATNVKIANLINASNI